MSGLPWQVRACSVHAGGGAKAQIRSHVFTSVRMHTHAWHLVGHAKRGLLLLRCSILHGIVRLLLRAIACMLLRRSSSMLGVQVWSWRGIACAAWHEGLLLLGVALVCVVGLLPVC